MKKSKKKSPHSQPKQDKDLKNNFYLIISQEEKNMDLKKEIKAIVYLRNGNKIDLYTLDKYLELVIAIESEEKFAVIVYQNALKIINIEAIDYIELLKAGIGEGFE